MWAITVMGFYAKAGFGLLGVVLSVCWLLQVILYIFIQPPPTPFLNLLFTRLDRVFGLFGVAAFALFCFYIIGGQLLFTYMLLFHCIDLTVMLAWSEPITERSPSECLHLLQNV